MSRRPRQQAVPLSADEARRPRPPRRPRPGGDRRWGCGWWAIVGAGMALVIVGLARVVGDLPAAPSPSPAQPLPITFGYTLDEDTYLVTDPGDQFRPGDVFAYSVSPPDHPGVSNVYVAIVQYRAGVEVVLQPPSPQRLLPEPITFGYRTTTADMIELFGYGRFTMKIYLDPDGPVYARGRFEIVEPAIPP